MAAPKLNFTAQKHKFSLSGTRFAESYLPAAGNIFAGLTPMRSNAFRCMGVGATASLKLSDSPMETSFRTTVERSASKARKLCTAVLSGARFRAALLRAEGEGKREAWMDRIRKQLDAGQVDRVIAALKPHRDRFEAVAACANRDRMRYDLCRKRGLPVGSGIVESVCKRIVGNRFKQSGRHWPNAGANAVLAIRCCLENMRWPDFLD